MSTKQVKDFLDYAAARYYASTPVLSDEEFDALAEQYGYVSVGTSHPAGIAHAYRMYSLSKVYPEDTPPFIGGVETIKLDGAAISLLYVKGEFWMALTRGDGIRGQDITDVALYLNIPRNIPKNISYKSIVQITGEVVAPASIPNARNYAAGALNLKSVAEFQTRDLSFVAYGVNPFLTSSFEEDMKALQACGFDTVLTATNLSRYPTDGYVVRMSSNKAFENAGYTAHHPRGAYARKEQKEGVVTTLEKVIWNVGRSGVVSPVAVFTPIEIDGAVVSKATLHNMKHIEALNLEIGCKVKVIRSGDIIPRIIQRVD